LFFPNHRLGLISSPGNCASNTQKAYSNFQLVEQSHPWNFSQPMGKGKGSCWNVNMVFCGSLYFGHFIIKSKKNYIDVLHNGIEQCLKIFFREILTDILIKLTFLRLKHYNKTLAPSKGAGPSCTGSYASQFSPNSPDSNWPCYLRHCIALRQPCLKQPTRGSQYQQLPLPPHLRLSSFCGRALLCKHQKSPKETFQEYDENKKKCKSWST